MYYVIVQIALSELLYFIRHLEIAQTLDMLHIILILWLPSLP